MVKQALSYFAKSARIFVLLDVVLPDVDGFPVAQRIRGQKTRRLDTHHCPLTLVKTGYWPERYAAGADDYQTQREMVPRKIRAGCKRIIQMRTSVGCRHGSQPDISSESRTQAIHLEAIWAGWYRKPSV